MGGEGSGWGGLPPTFPISSRMEGDWNSPCCCRRLSLTKKWITAVSNVSNTVTNVLYWLHSV